MLKRSPPGTFAAIAASRARPAPPLDSVYRFGRFELQPGQRQLLADGRPVGLGQRAFDVLHALVERRERLVTKSELLDVVWPGVVVEENNLQVQISALRKLLGPQAIGTVPGRGYRFTAALEGAAVSAPKAAGPARPAMGLSAPGAPGTNLPTELPPLYGREEDLEALRRLIDAHRLVTVVGAGGIGKSRLAQAVALAQAGCRPDGAWMVEFAGLSDPALLERLQRAFARIPALYIADGHHRMASSARDLARTAVP